MNRTNSPVLGLDVGRVFAVLAVMWIHSPNEPASSTLVARWAVPFFAAASTCLATYSSEVSGRVWLLKRFRRTYVPFLLWNAVFFLVRAGSAALTQSQLPRLNLGILLLNGTVHHLWFLPFVLVVGFGAFVVGRLSVGRATKIAGLGVLVVGAAAFDRSDVLPSDYGYFWGLAWDNLPAAFGGALLGTATGSVPGLVAASRRLWRPSCSIFALAVALPVLTGQRIVELENLAGVFSVLAFSALPGCRTVSLLARLAPNTFGVYVLHVLFIEGFQDLLKLAGISLEPMPQTLASFIVAVVCSFCVSSLLRANRILRSC